MKETRTVAKYKGRIIVAKMVGADLWLRPLGKHWEASGVRVPIVDIFKMGRKRRGAERARDKAAIKRAKRKLRRAMKHGEDGDGVNVLTEREMFLLAHMGRRSE